MTTSSRAPSAGIAGLAAALLTTSLLVVATPSTATAAPDDARPAQSQGQGHGRGGVRAQDPTTFTIVEALKALKTNKYTSVELVEAFLERIETYEPYYNAFTQMNEDALADAAASDARRASKAEPRPLEGVPIVIKDTLDMVGFPTTAAWPVTTPDVGGLSLMPESDAPLTARLEEAGAIILGRTNLPILAGSGSNANNSAFGPTFNALDQDWAPGGSSTGSATAVAGDFAIAGIAEETGGSIQNPASAQSLYAVKPTFGLVPNVGNFPLAGSTRDVLGPLAKTVEDAALMMDVFAGYTPEDPKTEAAIGKLPDGGYTEHLSKTALRGKRIGLYGPGWRTANGELSEETQELYDEAVANLEAQGAIVVEDPFAGSGFADLAPGDGRYDARGGEDRTYQTELYLQRLGATSPVNSVEELRSWAEANGFGDDRSLERLTGDPTVQPDMSAFYELRDEYLSIFDSVMTEHDLDALVFPQQVREIGPIFGGGVAASTVSEINIAQLPGVVVPDGTYESGKPFSLIFVGEQWSEDELLGYAYDYADAYDGRVVNRELSTTAGPTP